MRKKIVRAKFTQNPHMARYLVQTGKGENHLGRILMALREDFQKNGIPEEEVPPHFRFEASAEGIAQEKTRKVVQQDA